MKDQKGLSRRQMLKTLGAGTVAATVTAALPKACGSTGSTATSMRNPVARCIAGFCSGIKRFAGWFCAGIFGGFTVGEYFGSGSL